MGDTAASARLRAQLGRGTAVATLPDPAAALPFLLRADLALPHHAQDLGAGVVALAVIALVWVAWVALWLLEQRF